jgi:Uma2 family endonuclease
MGSLLDNAKVRQAVYPLSVEFYHAVGELGLLGTDVELLEGTLVKKMAKSPFHSWLVQRLFKLLTGVLAPGWCVRLEQPLTLVRSEPEPDLAVLRGMPDDFREHHPVTAELVIEVAVSSLEVDRQKAAIYASAGVKEYWIFDPEARAVEVYRNPTSEGGYLEHQVLSTSDCLESTAVPGLVIEVSALFDHAG